MSFWRKYYYKLIYCIIKLLIKSKVIPSSSINNINTNISNNILYVLPYYSIIDLLILRQKCFSIGLPDPLHPIKINKKKIPAYIFINKKQNTIFGTQNKLNENSINIFTKYIYLNNQYHTLNIQILLVLVLFGRSPKKETNIFDIYIPLLNKIKKLFQIFWLGRDTFIYYSPLISLKKIITIDHTADLNFIKKLARIANIYFIRLKLAIIGPQLPKLHKLFKKLLSSELIHKAINDETKNKHKSLKKVKKHALNIMKEIAAKFSYEIIRITDRILQYTWNKVYKGINIQHAERVRQLAYTGYNIVYIPSHKSHMDYLLLSYVLYHQGLMLPHIVAGINLNFWPAGIIFRHLGAFFIRRSFKGNKLYSAIFKEYLSELFARGYSIEYFIEGGRSRTGRLLTPKTGTLSITIQAMLQTNAKKICIVPVYIGYDQVLEVKSYFNELNGIKKQKESIIALIKSISKLQQLGQSYVNFGKPIALFKYLNLYIPNWKEYISTFKIQRPIWLNAIAGKLANHIMININNTASVNAVNLCSTILLASENLSLTKKQMLKQINNYLNLFKNVPYTDDITLPNKNANDLLKEAMILNCFLIKIENNKNILFLSHKNATLMSYYKNNIIHIFIIPSIIANILLHYNNISRHEVHAQIILLYPLLKAELFLKYTTQELPIVINKLLDELARQKLIFLIANNIFVNNNCSIMYLKILANHSKEILERYIILLSLLNASPNIDKRILKNNSYLLAKKLTLLQYSSSMESLDNTIFLKLINTLKTEGYISNNYNIVKKNIELLYSTIYKLIPNKTIEIINNTQKKL
uniref:Glycerol-3-phosphate acyltransferase n=1 Tax=Candidatus Aschnera chinzeii TaxID=1485666 RepID=A0AAT9G499_9ENTR|nr:MAG: glycerol-3-phosphate 1-O-acyltransferase PlsB [Candidatus Aschnera chinzeii]